MRRAALTIAFLLWGAALHFSAHAQPIELLTPKQQNMIDLYIRTRMCMRTAGIAAVTRSHDPVHIQQFMRGACSTPLLVFLRNDMTEAEAQLVIDDLTRDAFYEDVMGLPEPQSNK